LSARKLGCSSKGLPGFGCVCLCTFAVQLPQLQQAAVAQSFLLLFFFNFALLLPQGMVQHSM
jgi:hypothetical protein